MLWVEFVIALALLEFVAFGIFVARARARYHIAAPATSGNEMFERHFRVHYNTLEQLIVFVPAILLFASHVSARWAALIGAVYLIGRIIYFRDYTADPKRRSLGFGLSMLPTLALLIGGLVGLAVEAARTPHADLVIEAPR